MKKLILEGIGFLVGLFILPIAVYFERTAAVIGYGALLYTVLLIGFGFIKYCRLYKKDDNRA
jgi:hypothetical protein